MVGIKITHNTTSCPYSELSSTFTNDLDRLTGAETTKTQYTETVGLHSLAQNLVDSLHETDSQAISFPDEAAHLQTRFCTIPCTYSACHLGLSATLHRGLSATVHRPLSATLKELQESLS